MSFLLIVISLLQAFPQFVTDDDEKSLIVATTNGDLELIKELIENGSDVNILDHTKSSALHVASKEGHLLIVRFLIEKGANVDVRDRFGWTPFLLAASEGYLDIASHLLENGANLDAADSDEINALMWAGANEQEAMVKFLLDKGINPITTDKRGRTAFDFVKFSDNKKIKNLLKISKSQEKLIDRSKAIAPKQKVKIKPIKDFNGKEFATKNYLGKIVLLDFWATWCEPCKMSIPFLKNLNKKMDSTHFDLISISVDKDSKIVKAFVEENEMEWKHFVDSHHSSYSYFGIKSFPTYILIDAEGNAVKAWKGYSEQNERAIRLAVYREIKARKKEIKKEKKIKSR